MRAIDGDALDDFLASAEIEAINKKKYVLAGALNTIRGNLRNFPSTQPDCTNCIWDVCNYNEAMSAQPKQLTDSEQRIFLAALATEYIKQLPSVQQIGWVHRDDIYRLISGHSNYHGDNILAALTCLAERKKDAENWIPVSDKLPEQQSKTLVTTVWDKNDRCVEYAYYLDDDCKWGVISDYVIAWMPLPEAYDGVIGEIYG